MIICLLVEGSYPYVVGGVSSWINKLVNSLPQVKFKILSIMPSDEETLEVKYKIPGNIIELKTVYLNGYIDSKNYSPIKQIKKNKNYNELVKLFEFDNELDLSEILDIVKNKRISDINNFTRTKYFYNSINNIYLNNFSELNYNKYVWTIKNMFSPLLYILNMDLPTADIYHSISAGYAGLLGAVGKVKYNKPFILSEHGIYTRERQEEIIKADWVKNMFKEIWIDFFFFISNIGYQYADKITSLFTGAKEFQIMYGANKEKCTIIPNGVDVNSYNIKKEEHTTFNIGFITRVVPIKDVLTAIRAFFIINKRIQNVQFYIIGPTDEDQLYYKQCKRLVKEFNLDNVIFTGTVNIHDYLKIIDVVMLSSLSEGQPLVLLEAMASGICCVTSNVGSCKEVLNADKDDSLKCGLIFEATNYEHLASKIIHLYENPKLRKLMGENGKKRAMSNYNYKDMVNNYYNLYKSVIG